MEKIQQFKVYSLTDSRICNANCDLALTYSEAERNKEIIALADNECLREIRRITNHSYDGEKLAEALAYRKRISRRRKSAENASLMRQANEQIAEMLFIPEFVTVHVSKKPKYRKIASRGFLLNGEKYIRLMCGAGHARTNRAMFVKKSIFPQIDKFLRASCNNIDIIWAKWNAYYALGSSATHIVSAPRACVIPDYEVKRDELVDFVTPTQPQGVIKREIKNLSFNLWDGMGLISPEFAEKWGAEVGCDYVSSAFIVRCAFIKGLCATFDFHKFAREVAHKDTITDVYGNEHNIFDIDVILTESQFKLWKAYDSWNDYCEKTSKLGWHWGITKCADDLTALKKRMMTNYQFLQVLNLSDEDIKNICSMTVKWLDGVSGRDIDKALLYLLGKIADLPISAQEAFGRVSDPFVKCLIANPTLIKDSYIKNRIADSINKRLREACMGRLMVEGTYQLLTADPYGLCEYMFGMEVKGLLDRTECYNQYWNGKGASHICALRSPMTWRSEVNGVYLVNNDNTREWYKYQTTTHIQTILGVDNMLAAGSDEDGDALFITDNEQFWNGRCE